MLAEAKVYGALPGAVEVFIAALVQLHPFTVKLFLDNEFVVTHFFDCILNLSRRSLAQHGCKRVEELDFFVLGNTSQRKLLQVGAIIPLHSADETGPIVPMQFSSGQSTYCIGLVRQGEKPRTQLFPSRRYSCLQGRGFFCDGLPSNEHKRPTL